MTKRVVITGLGAISPVGNHVDDIWHNMILGQSGIDTITLFDSANLPTHIAGEVKGFDAQAAFGRKEARRLDRYSQFTLAAGIEAVEDAILDNGHVDRNRVGVVVGTGIGGGTTFAEQCQVLQDKGARKVSPFFISMILPDSAPSRLAIEYGFTGPSMSIASACATSNNALGEAYEMIARGAADVIISGGVDAPINLPIVAGFSVMKALSTQNVPPQAASRPFDSNRDGFVIAEGAAILVLEELEHAKARQAKIYAEFIGYGTSVDAHHMVAPKEDAAGAVLSMQAALNRANIQPIEVDYVNAHGTSTPLNDAAETLALKKALGEHAYVIPISSTKSMTGHLLGGAGAIEAIACIKALQSGLIPPTINYQTPDTACDLDYTPNTARQANITIAMSNVFGFGGHNATIILKKYAN